MCMQKEEVMEFSEARGSQTWQASYCWAPPPQFLIQQVWGEAQEFSNKFSGDVEVAGLGTEFGNRS